MVNNVKNQMIPIKNFLRISRSPWNIRGKINIEKMKVDGKYKKNWDLIRDDNTWMGEKAITNYSS